MTDLNTIYSWFQTGDFPTQEQFQKTFASFWHRAEKLPVSAIEGLGQMFSQTVSSEIFNTHLQDSNAHAGFLAKLDASNLKNEDVNAWKEKLQIAYHATVDSQEQTGNVYTKEQIAELLAQLQLMYDTNSYDIQLLRSLLESDDLNLDELQEIADFIKQNRQDIETLQAVALGVTTEDKVNLNTDHGFAGANTQERFNEVVAARLKNSKTAQVTASGIIAHELGTDNLIIQARDSVTGKEMNCENYAGSASVQINFLEDLVNPVNVLILKIIP